MLKNEMSTYDKILQVTVDLIKKEETSTITVRRVAELANVNIAAVNYHFQSKENLINLATKEILFSLKGIFDFLDNPDIPAKERFKQFLIAFAKAVQQFPDPIKRIISSDSLATDSRAEFLAFLQGNGRKSVNAILTELTGETDPRKLHVLSVQTYSAIMLPILLMPISDVLKEGTLPGIEYQVETLVEVLSK